MSVLHDAQGRAFSMKDCPTCRAAGPHFPHAPNDQALFACFECDHVFSDIADPGQTDYTQSCP